MPHFAEILSTNDRLVEILKIYGEPVASDSADAALQKVAMDHGLFQFLDRCEHGSAAFPPCRVCGVAMDLFLATPEIDTRAEERMFKCRTCGMFESKLVEIK